MAILGRAAKNSLCGTATFMKKFLPTPGHTVNLSLVIIKYKHTSWTFITAPQKYVFDFME
jgi:hypothetical protein